MSSRSDSRPPRKIGLVNEQVHLFAGRGVDEMAFKGSTVWVCQLNR